MSCFQNQTGNSGYYLEIGKVLAKQGSMEPLLKPTPKAGVRHRRTPAKPLYVVVLFRGR